MSFSNRQKSVSEKNRNEKALSWEPLHWFALAVGIFALLRLAVLGHGLGMVSFDDGLARDGWLNAQAASANLDLDYSIGRFYAPLKFASLGWLQAEATPLLQSITRVLALALGAAGVAMFSSRWTGCRRDSVIGAALFLAAYPFYEGYQAYFSNPLLLMGLGATCISAALITRPENHARAGSLALLTFALLCHELFVMFAVLHLALIWRHEGRTAVLILRRLAPVCTILFVYVILNFAIRAAGEVSYDGVQLSLRPLEMLNALLRYTVASVPGIEFWFDRASTSGLPIRNANDALAIIAAQTDAWSFVLPISAGVLAYLHFAQPLSKRDPACPPSRVLYTSAFLLLLVVLPNVLPTLTQKYQIWAMQRRLPYYYGVLGLGFGSCGLIYLRHILRRPIPALSVSVGFGIILIVFLTQVMNAEVVLRLSHKPVDLDPVALP